AGIATPRPACRAGPKLRDRKQAGTEVHFRLRVCSPARLHRCSIFVPRSVTLELWVLQQLREGVRMKATDIGCTRAQLDPRAEPFESQLGAACNGVTDAVVRGQTTLGIQAAPKIRGAAPRIQNLGPRTQTASSRAAHVRILRIAI